MDFSEDHTIVEPLIVPNGCKAGDRIYIEDNQGVPDELLNPKKKIWEKYQVDLKTNASGEATWNSCYLLSNEQKLTSKLANCSIK